MRILRLGYTIYLSCHLSFYGFIQIYTDLNTRLVCSIMAGSRFNASKRLDTIDVLVFKKNKRHIP